MKSIKNRTAFLIISLVVFIFVSCSMDHKIPKAKIKLLNFIPLAEKHPVLDIYNVNFTSDIAIDSLLKEIKGNPYLFCSLNNGNIDFDIEDTSIDKPHLLGSFEKAEHILKKEKLHHYVAEVIFYNANGVSEGYLSKEQIKKQISGIECISCKVINRFFMDTRKPYLSNPMCIPVKDILTALDQ